MLRVLIATHLYHSHSMDVVVCVCVITPSLSVYSSGETIHFFPAAVVAVAYIPIMYNERVFDPISRAEGCIFGN